MKKKFSNKILLALLVSVVLFSCKEEKKHSTTTTHTHTASYTCPMHPQVVQSTPGACPICGMDLVATKPANDGAIDTSLLPLLKPVNEQVISTMPSISPESGTRIFSVPIQGVIAYDERKQVSLSSRVAGRIERMMVKYNYQPVKKGQLIMEIYSPDLAAAQRELIYISRSDNSPQLLQAARQKLLLLGMKQAQLQQVIRTGKPIYRVPVYSPASGFIVEKSFTNKQSSFTTSAPANTGSGMDGMAGGATTQSNQVPSTTPTPVVLRESQYVAAGESIFTIYLASSMIAEFSLPPSLSTAVRVGQKLVYHSTTNEGEVHTATIGLLEPRQRGSQSFLTARVYLPGTHLQPGQLVQANIPLVVKSGFWLPAEAVLQLGNHSVVFKKEGQVYLPKEVTAGVKTNGLVQVTDTIGDWQVAKNASFLVDSESFIRLNKYGEQ